MGKSKTGSELLGGGREKFIETDTFRIAGHLLQWKDVAIQISNVSMISTANVRLPRFPAWTVLLFLAGAVILEWQWQIPLLLFVLGAVVIYAWHMDKEEKKKLKALTISLNSGETYFILFSDVVFLHQVLDVFSGIFEEGGKSTETTYKIDIQNCRIDHESSFITAGKE